MSHPLQIAWKLIRVGGWAPSVVFLFHGFLSKVHAYDVWPPTDIPMHLAGGLAIAFFTSRVFLTLPRHSVPRSRLVTLELVLVGSITSTVAVLWELSEFTFDQIFGTDVQVDLANTMRDLAMGMAGALLFIFIRAVRQGVGLREIREVAADWARGQAA